MLERFFKRLGIALATGVLTAMSIVFGDPASYTELGVYAGLGIALGVAVSSGIALLVAKIRQRNP